MRGWLIPAAWGTAAGVIAYLLGTSMLDGPQSWQRWSPYPGEHVTTAIADRERREVLAATQAGNLLHYQQGSGWQLHEDRLPENGAPLVLARDNDRVFLGTQSGTHVSPRPEAGDWSPVEEGLPKDVHLLDLSITEGGSGVATSPQDGVFVREANDAEQWQQLERTGMAPEASPYRSLVRSDGSVVTGTIDGAGVYRWHGEEQRWQADGAGLPEERKVFTLIELPDGALLAGTDQGAYYQPEASAEWSRVDPDRQAFRVLHLALDANGYVWAASDEDGYRSVSPWSEEADVFPAQWKGFGHDGLEANASWILPGDPPLLVAGAVYELDIDPAFRNRVAIAALVLAIAVAAVLRFRSLPPTYPNRSTS